MKNLKYKRDIWRGRKMKQLSNKLPKHTLLVYILLNLFFLSYHILISHLSNKRVFSSINIFQISCMKIPLQKIVKILYIWKIGKINDAINVVYIKVNCEEDWIVIKAILGTKSICDKKTFHYSLCMMTCVM